MSTAAAALAYQGLLALFPFVLFLVALTSLLRVDRVLDWLGNQVQQGSPVYVPLPVQEWFIAQFPGRPGGGVLLVGALAAIWATATGMRMLRAALHKAYGVPDTRAVWRQVVVSVVVVPAYTLAGIVATALLVVTSRTFMRVAGVMTLDAVFVAVWRWCRVPAAFVLLACLFSLAYRSAAGDRPSLRRLLPGAALAAALWALVSAAFPFALTTVLNFGVTYGSFSAAIVVLVYLDLLVAALLLGAELNAAVDARPAASTQGSARD